MTAAVRATLDRFAAEADTLGLVRRDAEGERLTIEGPDWSVIFVALATGEIRASFALHAGGRDYLVTAQLRPGRNLGRWLEQARGKCRHVVGFAERFDRACRQRGVEVSDDE